MKLHNFIGRTKDEIFCIKGIDLFRYKWYSGGKCASVINPENGKMYSFSSYYIEYGKKKLEFIAGKDEYGNWLFFED